MVLVFLKPILSAKVFELLPKVKNIIVWEAYNYWNS